MPVKTYSMKRNGNIKLSANFTLKEMQSHDGADEVKVDSALIDYLQQIRDHFGKPVHINSGYRSPAHNKAVGGMTNSYHTKGQAADIVISVVSPKRVAQYAEAIGVNGIGWYENKRFTHVDTRKKPVFWHYNAAGKISYVKTFSDCPYAEPSENRKFGDKGAAWIQWHLKKCGAKISIDGKFGPNTKAAVIAFQKKHGLATDGIVGAKTRQALKIEVI